MGVYSSEVGSRLGNFILFFIPSKQTGADDQYLFVEVKMIETKQVDVQNRKQVNEFVALPYRLYANVPQWVPPFYSDMRAMLDPKKHPFYEHSDADFFTAWRGGEMVGRIAALENKPYNQYHGKKVAAFYLFDSIDDQDVANALFERAFEWSRKRGLTRVVGPKGLSGFDGYGIQIEGFEHRQMMTMMNYNFPYYQKLVEVAGFEKEVDFVSCYIPQEKLQLPEKALEIARRVKERGTFQVKSFENRKELKKWAKQIGNAYNNAFVNNWEYYPLTEREVNYVVDTVVTIADPKLIKIILHGEDVVGFIFGFPDVSDALQRCKGRLTPWGIVDLLREFKRTKWISGNGVGVLPEYHGRGGTALMYAELEKTVKEYKFQHLEMTQVAETAVQMRRDLINLGGSPYKNHRVYHRDI